MIEESKENIFVAIQKFLKKPPLIVWGSGATVALGLPTMSELNEILGNKIEGFGGTSPNLEEELGKEKYSDQLPEIRKVIWKAVSDADKNVFKDFLNGHAYSTSGIKCMIEKFRSAHPKVVNVVTTNYDRVLEHILSFYDIPFTDGFTGRELSLFNIELFQSKNMVNLVKVHGSLNWFGVNGHARYLTNNIIDAKPLIISPGKNKYRETYKSPYRELIQESDRLIKEAASFLIVGFGFNDEHLTPEIKAKVKEGTPLVLITKEVTKSCYTELKDAQKFVFLQDDVEGTAVSLKSGNYSGDFKINGEYWKLDKFMGVL